MKKLFINPNGVLCYEYDNYTWNINIFKIYPHTKIDVYPVIDGFGVNGRLINIEDFHYESHKK